MINRYTVKRAYSFADLKVVVLCEGHRSRKTAKKVFTCPSAMNFGCKLLGRRMFSLNFLYYLIQINVITSPYGIYYITYLYLKKSYVLYLTHI